MDKYILVAQRLEEIRSELEKLGLWDVERPGEEAFTSDIPFNMNTMEFHEWLRFVMIETFNTVLENRAPLPHNVKIFPYATEVYRNRISEYKGLLKAIYNLDLVFAQR